MKLFLEFSKLMSTEVNCCALKMSDFEHQNVLHNHRKLCPVSKNWSGHVFFSALNEFREKIFFCDFSENFRSKNEDLVDFGRNFEISTTFFWKNAKKYFLTKFI